VALIGNVSHVTGREVTEVIACACTTESCAIPPSGASSPEVTEKIRACAKHTSGNVTSGEKAPLGGIAQLSVVHAYEITFVTSGQGLFRSRDWRFTVT